MIYQFDKKSIVGIIIGLLSSTGIAVFKNCGLVETFSVFIILSFIILKLQTNQLAFSNKRRNKYCVVLAVLMALSMLINYAVNVDGRPEWLIQSSAHVIVSFFGFFGYFLFFYFLFLGLFLLVEDNGVKFSNKNQETAFERMMRRKPFLFSFLILLVSYIPYIILSYPAVFLEDGITSLVQGFTGSINTHHPAIYTIILTELIKLAYIVSGSWNISIFACSLIQLFITLAIICFGIKILINDFEIFPRFILFFIFYFIINPRIANYMMMVAKDTMYAAFLLLLFETIIEIIKTDNYQKNCALLLIALFGVICFRNEGIYVVLITLIVFLIANWHNKYFQKFTIILAIVITSIHFLYLSSLSTLGIESGSKREMLSIPLQQTALCVTDHRDEITDYEEKVILSAFSDSDYGFENLDYIVYQNDPISKADRIKAAFCWDVTSPEAIEYYKLWFQMGLKYPWTYVKALILANYQYFDFETKFECIRYQLGVTSQNALSQIPPDFSYPQQLDGIRNLYESVREKVFSCSPFSILNNAGTYTWILIIWITILLYKKHYQTLQLAVIPIVIMLICFASPCNGFYCRYQFPLQLCLPFAIVAGLKLFDYQEEYKYKCKVKC